MLTPLISFGFKSLRTLGTLQIWYYLIWSRFTWNRKFEIKSYFHFYWKDIKADKANGLFITISPWTFQFDLEHDKTIQMAYAPIEDSDQPGNPSSLIRVVAVCFTGNLGPKPSSDRRQRLWLDWTRQNYRLVNRDHNVYYCDTFRMTSSGGSVFGCHWTVTLSLWDSPTIFRMIFHLPYIPSWWSLRYFNCFQIDTCSKTGKKNNIRQFVIWAAPSEFGTYRLCEQRRFRRACASAQSRQNLRCSLIQAVSQEEPSDRKPDPWPLWMAGHAQLKFVMTECSKTQIRLARLI